MADAEQKKQRKRKAEDADDEDADFKPKKTGKKAPADGEPAPTKSAPKRTKPLTPEEQEIASKSSMERNVAIAAFIKGVWDNYKNEKEWIKAASAKKAYDSIAALTEPIKVAKELAVLPGVGKGTVEKIEAFLRENPTAGGSAGGAFGTLAGPADSGASGAAAADDADAYLKDLDKEVVVEMVKSGELSLDKVRKYRTDISEDDV